MSRYLARHRLLLGVETALNLDWDTLGIILRIGVTLRRAHHCLMFTTMVNIEFLLLILRKNERCITQGLQCIIWVGIDRRTLFVSFISLEGFLLALRIIERHVHVYVLLSLLMRLLLRLTIREVSHTLDELSLVALKSLAQALDIICQSCSSCMI